MKRYLIILLSIMLSMSAMAQQNIKFRSADKAECVKSDMTSLKATFSFSGLEAHEMQSERGVFSTLTMPNTVIGGNEGDPLIPVVNQLIAIPFGTTPTIRVTHYSATDYDLEDYGIHTLSPRQPEAWKDEHPENVPFVYNETAYQTPGLRLEPMARVEVEGVMRGVRVGQMSIEPVSYDPVNNRIRVFNDIEVEVSFDGADSQTTEDRLVKTYSPYFMGVYDQLFNGRALRDVYDEHPDLWTAPVKMLVIANRMFENCIQNWVAWKTLKGIYVDVNYTDVIGTTAEEIQSFIREKYAEDAPTFLMIMGDQEQVAPSGIGSKTACVTDLLYSSVDDDQFPDMFHSRLSAETVGEMTAMLNKGMEYEQYTMPDPSYLNNALFVAGYDNTGWDIKVGRPTVWYATNYYYNTEHGFNNVYEFSHGSFDNCYTYLNSGVGFANYTAHGTETSWMNPEFTIDGINALTNEHKYFLAMGNCCKTGNWGFESPCFGETMVRAENKGAYAYIGSCPSTTWYNDYYFGVGATNPKDDGTMPTYEETTMGCYDAIWRNDAYNTVCAILYTGNLSGNAARALGYPVHCNPLYYWEAYHVLGDGSIMPYRVQPTNNIVSHLDLLPIGIDTYEVDAVPGSYVAISKDGVLLGTALVGESGRAYVPITPVTTNCNVTICVTAPQRIPYIVTIPADIVEGPYISADSFTPTSAYVGETIDLSIDFKNVGTEPTTGTTTVVLTSEDPRVEMINPTNTFETLAANAITTVSGFKFCISQDVADGEHLTIHYAATNADKTWEGNIVVNADKAVLAYHDLHWNGSFVPGETVTVTVRFKNKGHYQATNAVATMSSASDYIDISNPSVPVGTIAVDEMVTCQFTATIAANCPEDEPIPVTFAMTADGGLSVQAQEVLKNACKIVFELGDSYGDGWGGNRLTVSFDDGSPSQELTVEKGGGAFYEIAIGHGVHVTLTWTSASFANECSFVVKYENDFVIYQTNGTPTAGVLHEFDCDCASAYQTFTVTTAPDVNTHGTVTGGGVFDYGQSCTVTANPAENYFFINWTLNNEVVSYTPSYTFNVTGDMHLVAHFIEGRVIGDGGDATSDYLPSYSLYKNTLSEQIYTSEEFGDAGVVTSIAFYNGGTAKTRNFDIYMKATSKSTFTGNKDWETISASDKVFSGSVSMVVNDWTVITLDPPFFYDGVSNVVLVSDDHTTTTGSGLRCRVFNASSQAIRAYSEGTDYDPMNTSTYSGTIMNVKNQLRITKAAPSTEPVNILASASPTQGGTVTGGGAYTFGESCTVTATANTGYYFNGWTENNVIISNDSEISFVVLNGRELVATFIPAFEVGEGTTTNNLLPSYSYRNYAMTQQIYTAEEIGIAGTINSIAFYNGGGEKTRTFDFYLATTEKSSFSSNTDWITMAESDKVFSGSVTMTANAWTFIIFDTPFEYDGTSNLLLVTDDNTGSSTTTTDMACSVYPTSTPQALYAYHYATNLKPTSPPTAPVTGWSGNFNDTLSVKNHILLGISLPTFNQVITGYGEADGGYYFIATPVGTVNPAAIEGMILTGENAENYDLYSFDQAQANEWRNYKQDGGFSLVSGKGYLYAQKNNVTLTFTGEPYCGSGEVALDYTPNTAFAGWNLIGNPYACNATLDQPYYRLNEERNALKTETESSPVAAMEGVFVQATAADQTATFEPQTRKTERLAIPLTNIVVCDDRGAVLDNAILRLDNGAALGKFQLSAQASKVYFSHEGKDYAVVNADNANEIPVYFKAEKDGRYTLSFTNKDVTYGYLHLVDNLTGADVDLLINSSYSFDAKVSDYASRFRLVFNANNDNESEDSFAFVSNGQLIVNGEGTLQVIDMLGRVIVSRDASRHVSTTGIPAGVYVLRLINGENVKNQKIIIESK